ncbi:MAG: hypothetical protein NC124_04185 [Clostridium sp.]|nr:hypothetical protein [Clostridium sp.]
MLRKRKRPEYTGKKETEEEKNCGVIEDFPDIRKITQEEKKQYLERRGRGNGCLSVFMGVMAVVFGNAAFRLLSELHQRIVWQEKIAFLLLFLFVLGLSGVFIVSIVAMNREKRWILKTDCFHTTGYSYQKKEEKAWYENGSETLYYAKVWDGDSVYLSRWFPIGAQDYAKEEPVEFDLYFYHDKSGYTEIDAYAKEDMKKKMS